MRRSHDHPRVPSKPAFESPNGARLCLKGQSQQLCPGGSIGMNPDATALADMLRLGLRPPPRSWPPLCIALPSWITSPTFAYRFRFLTRPRRSQSMAKVRDSHVSHANHHCSTFGRWSRTVVFGLVAANRGRARSEHDAHSISSHPAVEDTGILQRSSRRDDRDLVGP